MDEPLDEAYLRWLYSQVGSVKLKNASRTYWALLRQLYTKEFVWIIPNDDNRLEDGRDLRLEFVREIDPSLIDMNWMELGCSVLEMLIGLSRRLNFDDGMPTRLWFWRLIDNLNLRAYTDNSKYDLEVVDEMLDDLVWRTYDSSGKGGLFPLRHPAEDQRNVEIWYQLSAYLQEQDETRAGV